MAEETTTKRKRTTKKKEGVADSSTPLRSAQNDATGKADSSTARDDVGSGPYDAQNDAEVKAEAVPEKAAEKPAERTYTESEVQAIIAQLLAKQKPEDENVSLYFLSVCAVNNEAELPGYGVIRPGQYLEIPKKEFFGKFMSPQVRKFIEKRRLLVLDGLSEQERRRYNCDYKRGEILTEHALETILDMPLSGLTELFRALGKDHKIFVARYINSIVDEAQRKGVRIDNRISLDLLRTLNSAAMADFPEGIFKQTIEAFKKDL